jgi:tetratricopeptide (TPR) repeat protein
MYKGQVVLIGIAILAVVGLYSLPKVVVDNDSDQEAEAFLGETDPSGEVDHMADISENDLNSIAQVKQQLFDNGEMTEDEASLDALMDVFRSLNKYDSAAFYAAEFATKFNTVEHWRKAGDAYYEAFTFALDEQKIRLLGTKTREAYEVVLQAQPDNYDVQHNVAMTYVAGSAPMQGIMMLRGIIEKDPSNQQALMSMGRMSIQTGQFENGVDRFESLVSYYPDDVEGNFFLGVCYYETGELVKAKAQFEKVKTLGAAPQIVTAADEYLERIK